MDEGLAMCQWAYYGITTAEDEEEAERMTDNLTISIENLAHFQCPHCKGWWSIGDAPKREYWFCPWCGEKCLVSEETDSDFDTNLSFLDGKQLTITPGAIEAIKNQME